MRMKVKLTAIVFSVLAGACFATPAASAAPQCFGKPATIVGTNGNNTLNGTPQKDVIVAKGGNDTIQSKSNDDRVCLGDGNDFAGTSRGFDKIDGGDGKDEIHGGGKAGQPDVTTPYANVGRSMSATAATAADSRRGESPPPQT